MCVNWCYAASIVSELLRMGAYYHQQNRRREVPYQCAQNRKVSSMYVCMRACMFVCACARMSTYNMCVGHASCILEPHL